MDYQLRHRFGSTRGFEGFVQGNHVTLLHDGAQCYPAMLEAIASARHEVLLEMYWFGSDKSGSRFANALIEKARQGLRVIVIYDAIGSLEADNAQWERMRAAGVSVYEYNPIAPWRHRFRIGVVNNRNHRKMLIVDRCVGFTGGVNIGDPWASLEDGGGGWRDDMVRIEGAAVREMCGVFLHGLSTIADPDVGSPPSVLENVSGGDAPVRVLANHYFGERRAIRRAYLERIEAAKRNVYITNSYFVPDGTIRKALSRAASRGVDVRVLLPAENDVKAVYYASRRNYGWLLKRGVRLFEWTGEILHAKTAAVDGEWCTVGTYNLDYRSWRFNLEVTVSIDDDEVTRALEARFPLDLERSVEVTQESLRYRSLGERFFENFFYLFRKLL